MNDEEREIILKNLERLDVRFKNIERNIKKSLEVSPKTLEKKINF